MSESTQPPTPGASPQTDVDVRYEKDVLVTAYGSPEYAGPREFIADAFEPYIADDVDLFEREVNTTEEVTITFDFEGTDPHRDDSRRVEESIELWQSADKRVIKRALEDGVIDPDVADWLDVEVNTRTDSSHTVPSTKPVSALLADVAESASTLEELDYEHSSYSGLYSEKWTREVPASGADADPDETESLFCNLDVSTRNVDRRRVLRHQSQRTPSDRYETAEDVDGSELPWSVQNSIHIETTTREEMETVTEALVLPLYDRLSNLSGISKIRLSDCEVTTVEEGACHNV